MKESNGRVAPGDQPRVPDWQRIIAEEVRRLQIADRLYRLYRDRTWASIPFQRLPLDLQLFAAGERSAETIGEFAALPRRVKDVWQRLACDLRLAGTATLAVPVGMWAFGSGLALPDADIALLGIGRHRFFAFHSGLLIWGMEQLYRRYLRAVSDAPRKAAEEVSDDISDVIGDGRSDSASTGVNRSPGWAQKVAGVGLGTAAVGVGLHLLIDVFQPKSIVFPFFGSLVDGTLIDDGLWLLGNALWCFRIARDVFVLALGDDLGAVAAWVKQEFVQPFFES
ncbi:MAG: hypothetical protein IMX01_09500 [Limnochordaceae bacterium]|nr:hypothetical protein [Limnochordaceae bacterium]